VDGESFAAIEAAGLEGWLAGVRKDLVDKTYRPQPVRRVMIPKPGGGERPLGIPTIGPIWRRAWEHVVPMFAFPPAIRKMIYTTDEMDKGLVGGSVLCCRAHGRPRGEERARNWEARRAA
jgi:hypothetical protein